jgi:hypothetical protein
VIDEFRQWERLMAAPPPDVRDVLDAFDPERDALLLLLPFQASDTFADRRAFGARRKEWVALEDKTVCDEMFDRAGVPRPACVIVAASRAALVAAASELDAGDGTVWAGDASRGFNGGGEYVRWVRDERGVTEAAEFFAARCDRVRVAPFIEGIPSSVHGFACDDGVAVFRPVELVTLRPPGGNRFHYSGAATYWDPAPIDRETMGDVVRNVGEMLRHDVGFRGAFTVDGIMSAEGWVPTEMNPRFGAGLGYAFAAAPHVPVDLLHHLVIEGAPTVRAADLEAAILPAADNTRWGGGWTTVTRAWASTEQTEIVHDAGEFRAVHEGERPDATIMWGPSVVGGFVRVTFDPSRVRHGPSIAPLVIDAFAFADRAFGAGIGPLSPPRTVR